VGKLPRASRGSYRPPSSTGWRRRTGHSQRWWSRYAIADALAIYFQTWLRRCLVGILILAFMVGCLFQLHVRLRLEVPLDKGRGIYTGKIFATKWLDPYEPRDKNLVGLANYDMVYILSVAAIFIFYFFYVRRRDDQRRYQDYRAMAEGLRVQIYWRLAGLTNSAADHYLSKQRSELDWIRGALRDVDVLDEISASPADMGVACDRVRLVRENWVKDQWKFFVGVPREQQSGKRPFWRRAWEWIRAVDIARDYEGKARARLDERWAIAARWADFALIPCVFLAYALARAFAGPQHLVIIGLAVLVLILALVGVYAKIRAFAAHAKQYARMGNFFQNAHHYLDAMLARDVCDLNAARGLLKELGEEALVENGDWCCCTARSRWSCPARECCSPRCARLAATNQERFALFVPANQRAIDGSNRPVDRWRRPLPLRIGCASRRGVNRRRRSRGSRRRRS